MHSVLSATSSVRIATAIAVGYASFLGGGGLASATPTGGVTTVRSVSAHACLDVPSGSKSVNVILDTRRCQGSADQTFDFRPVAATPDTYRIRNEASGLCASNYRNNVRQSSCAGDPLVPLYGEWTLKTVDATKHTYRIEDTETLSSTPYCMIFTHTGGVVLVGQCTSATNEVAVLSFRV